jgi:hypothetical protein
MLLPLLVVFSAQAFAQNVVLYERPNFEGRSRSFGIGKYRLFNQDDFNDLAASIKVPAGLVVLVYADADDGGGYGAWVDFLEDQPDLSRYNFQGKISYVDVFSRRQVQEGRDHRTGSSGVSSITAVYERNSIQNGRFVPGHWEGLRASGNPVNPTPVFGPEKPPNVPLNACTISGQITNDKPDYWTFVTLLRDDGSNSGISPVGLDPSGKYSFQHVPAGKYLVRPNGKYPQGEGRTGGLAPFLTEGSHDRLSCEPNGKYTVNFDIHSTEG